MSVKFLSHLLLQVVAVVEPQIPLVELSSDSSDGMMSISQGPAVHVAPLAVAGTSTVSTSVVAPVVASIVHTSVYEEDEEDESL